MLAIGIGGSQTALNEFTKPTPTAFYGTVLISPKRHGYETAVAVYEWATAGKAPPPVTLTSGILMTRANQADIRKQMGL
jgi:L-arabinose transport system substrate-binding protein